MHLLIMGYSSLARRRLIPAALRADVVEAVDMASRSNGDEADVPESKRGTVFRDYAEALEKSRADWVWISLVNSLHAEWTQRALASGRHVIVDKPAFLSRADAERLTGLATEKNLLLAEATVWPYHPQMRMFEETGQRFAGTDSVTAEFTFPPFASGNFRYQKKLGGGMLNDLGPYAVSAARLFLGGPADWMQITVTSRDGEVETGFACRMRRDERTMDGVFGFSDNYVNRLAIRAPNGSVELEPAFTFQPDKPGRIVERQKGTKTIRSAPEGDAFREFIELTAEAVRTKKTGTFAKILLDDALALEALRRAAEKG